MFDQPFVFLIFIGLVLKCFGYMVRDELLLRCMLAVGTGFDIAFYALQSPAILGSVMANSVLVSVNLTIIGVIVMERSTWFMTEKERIAFEYFKTLSPGQFRRIIRRARWTVAGEDTVLLHEGQRTDKLFFLETKSFTVKKRGLNYAAQGPAFAGEIMLLQGGVASATVIVPKGAVYAEWCTADLRRTMHRSRPLENALMARFGHDLADKVRNSVPLRPQADTPAPMLNVGQV
ncbi:cyclic nucleotide-binding domain-containing protein [Aliishimia ponticola]|uniref:Cyclic nucleotide-binding domain-containing protein n=1 Tax=Aliishimia ponticola TaxID=2499833 RepID=A0A4S4NAY2_9RHOB|nr:cyclic nucleotide-binding domain-containing protein [Aliishimia ponticola]THH35121.1 cyclic nucleotide-binding domain-containing protein [Aliishimia ponticola]